jgi:hypothetical protein
VCMVAIHAMGRGRAILWKSIMARGGAPGLAPDEAAACILTAGREAAAWFWCYLQDFVDIGVIPDGWAAVPQLHPFLGVLCDASAGEAASPRLCLNLPPGLSLPEDLTVDC